MKPHININALTLVGCRKNYTIPFFPGVNIIYGDSDTGKSSILEFINYLLGASHIELADEIKSTVEYAALELEINGAQYTVKRNIYNSKDYIEVYPSTFDQCSEFFPKKYSPNYKDESSPDGFYSDFLLDSLGFPKVKIKVSPSKANSDVKRLSFRNLFKYVYVNQDYIGSKGFLDISNWVQATTNKEVFKYIFNVLDSSITELEVQISEIYKESKALLQKYSSVSEFLRETDYDNRVSIDEAIGELDEILLALKKELEELNSKMVADSSNHAELKSIFNQLSLNEKRVAQEAAKTREEIEKYSRLKNDYENDISKINGVIQAQKRIGEATAIENPCPVCSSPLTPCNVNEHFYEAGSASLTEELKSLKRKKKSIQLLIDDLSVKSRGLAEEYSEYSLDLDRAREMLDTESRNLITPYLTQRDTLIEEIASKKQLRSQLVSSIKVRNQQQKIHDAYENSKLRIDQLQERLDKLKSSAPSIHEVLSDLSDYLKLYLKKVNIKNQQGIAISEKSFVPVIRGRDYSNITSGGLRTISSLGFMVALLEYAIDYEVNHPRLLMVDTVGKYLGKTTKEKYKVQTNQVEDEKEGISDPLKYQNIYEYILGVASRAERKGVPCQVILVDNDVPDSFIDKYKPYIVAHYSSSGENGLSVGLIDDVGS